MSAGKQRSWAAILSLAALLTIPLSMGCRGAKPVAGGTVGRIETNEGKPVGDVQIEVFRVENGTCKPIGIGVSDQEGRFAFVMIRAQGPLHLEPGDYRFTLESVGPVMRRWPPHFSQAEKSPLQKTWGHGDHELVLLVPNPK